MVPEGWQVKSLGEICSNDLQTGPFGSQLHAHEYVNDGVSVFMPKDLNGGRADLRSAAKITEEKSHSLKKHKLRKGDLLFSRRGDVARFALIDEKTEGSLCGTGCLRARPSSKHSPEFLSYFLQKDSVRKWLEQNAVGQTMPNMNTEILSELPLISASSKEEEDKIAKIISTWDRAIATTKQLLSNSHQQKKALMQQLLTGKRRFSEFKGDWKSVELGSLLEYKQPTPYLVKSTDYNNDYETPVLTAGKTFILGYTNEPEGIYKDKLPVIIFDDFTTDSKFVDFPFKAKSSAMKILMAREGISIKYVFEAMQMLDFTIGGHQRHWISIFSNLKIAIPEIAEQQKIASVLSTADSEIKTLKQQLNRLEQEKKALMQQLLTGKRRVRMEAE